VRARGTGTIETTSDGRHRPRLPGRNSKRLDPCATYEEAAEVLRAALERLAEDPGEGGMTLGKWAMQAIDARELAGQRAADSYRSVLTSHLLGTWLADVLLVNVTRGDVIAFVKQLATRKVKPGRGYSDATKAKRAKKLIGKSTAQNALNALRIVLEDAMDEELIQDNPARGVRLPSSIRKRARTHETSTYLTVAEQVLVLSCDAIPERERLAIAFAIGTGCRQNEQWHIRLVDLHLDDWTVTLRKTKNGKPRTVPLLPIAKQAIAEWLPVLKVERAKFAGTRHEDTRGLLFPTVRGCQRRGDPRDWQKWMAAAGLTAEKRKDGLHVRWHDLRHTCGTSLGQGWWGRAWSAEEIQVQLDHESVTTTERYVHLNGDMARKAAAATVDLTSDLTTVISGIGQKALAPPARFERTTFGLGSGGGSEAARELAVVSGDSVVRPLEDVALDVLLLIQAGRNDLALNRAVDLAERTVEAARVAARRTA